MRSWTVAAVVALVVAVQTTVTADDCTTMEVVGEKSTNAKLLDAVDKDTSTQTRRKRLSEDVSSEDISTVESDERLLEEEELMMMQNLEETPQVRNLVELRISKPVPLLEDGDLQTSPTIGSERRLGGMTPMTRMVHSLENTPALARRLMMKRMSGDDMLDSAMARAAQADPKGLLDGLLGGILGGGSDGNCTASGGTCNSGQCCPTLACIDVSILGLNLCL